MARKVADVSRPWIVVSGASGAMGALLVQDFASRGHPVLALDLQSNIGGIEFPDSAKGRMKSVELDLCDETAVTDALAIIGRDEQIELLVNAVGLIWNEPILNARLRTHSLANWQRILDANLTAPFVIATAVAARMARSGGGSIVNFSSIAAHGNVGQAAYGTAKAGIEGMTRSMAKELGPLGIRVNAIAPGFIDLPSTRNALKEEILKGYAGRTPVGRLGSMEDVISAVRFLGENAFVNGEILALDGGLRL